MRQVCRPSKERTAAQVMVSKALVPSPRADCTPHRGLILLAMPASRSAQAISTNGVGHCWEKYDCIARREGVSYVHPGQKIGKKIEKYFDYILYLPELARD